MEEKPFSSLGEHFGTLPDPRVEGRCQHKLSDIICIAGAAVVCGASSWSEVETFGKAKEGSQVLDAMTLDNPVRPACCLNRKPDRRAVVASNRDLTVQEPKASPDWPQSGFAARPD